MINKFNNIASSSQVIHGDNNSGDCSHPIRTNLDILESTNISNFGLEDNCSDEDFSDEMSYCTFDIDEYEIVYIPPLFWLEDGHTTSNKCSMKVSLLLDLDLI